MSESLFNSRHHSAGAPAPDPSAPERALRPVGRRQPERPPVSHLATFDTALAFNLSIMHDSDSVTKPLRFVFDRFLDVHGDCFIDLLESMLAGAGMDPRARDGDPAFDVLAPAIGQRRKRPQLIAAGWTHLAARALVAAFEHDGISTRPRTEGWRIEPSPSSRRAPDLVLICPRPRSSYWRPGAGVAKESGQR